MPLFGNKDKSGNMCANFASVENSIPGIPGGWAVSATIDGENLVVKRRSGDKTPVYLPLHKITNSGTIAESEIVAQQKSVVGRAAIGGLILGPLGAVIGGIDGAGSKQKKNLRLFWVVNYEGEGGISSISLEIVGATLGLKKFEKALKGACPNYGTTKGEPTIL